MNWLRIVLAVVFLLIAVTAIVAPFTGPQRPQLPEPRLGEKKYRLSDTFYGRIQGTPSINGLRKVNFIRAQLHFKDESPPLEAPVITKSSDDWEKKIEVDTRFETSPMSIGFEVGPFPDDPRLPGASPTLTVIADVTFPAKVGDDHFEARSESPREITEVTFYAAGEFEKLEADRLKIDNERARILAEFKQRQTWRYTLWWTIAAVCAAIGVGIAALPILARRASE